MARKKNKFMTDAQFAKALEELNAFKPRKPRGGRVTQVIPNKKKVISKTACRGKVAF